MRGGFNLFGIILIFYLKQIEAQDTIVLVNGKHLAAKIIEITAKKVKYKNNLDTLGPTYVLSRRDVERFIRPAGCFDIENEGYKDCVKDPNYYVIKNEEFTRRIISWDFTKIFFFRFNFSFDYINRNRSRGFAINIDQSLKDFDDSDNYQRYKMKNGSYVYIPRNKLSGGMYKLNALRAELKLYPYAHKKIVYWLGVGISAGQYGHRVFEQVHTGSYVTYHYQYYSVTSYGNYYTNTGRRYYLKEPYAGIFFDNGFIWRPKKHLAIQGDFSLGFNAVRLTEEKRFTPIPAVRAGLKVGHAF
jgi:hypothetical protein